MPENARMFREGDIIRGLSGNGYGITDVNMLEGLVTRVLPIADFMDNPDPIEVRVLVHRGDGTGIHVVNAQCFALVRPAEIDRTMDRCIYCYRPSVVTVDGEKLCERHASVLTRDCNRCGTRHNRSNMIFIDNRSYCHECASYMTFYTCSRCGRTTAEEPNDGLCKDCEERCVDDEHERYVCGYQHSHDQDELIFLRGKDVSRNPLFFGIEIEYAGAVHAKNHKVFRTVNELLKKKDTIMKSDSSVSGKHSLEIAYQPQTMSAILDDENGMREVHKLLTDAGLNANHHSCGFHVHINRSYFDNVSRNVAQARIVAICTALESSLSYVSGRDSSSLNQWASFQRYRRLIRYKREGTSSDYIREVTWFISNRYNAVNISNRSTIEFRFFAGTNDYDVMLKRLRLITAIVEYAKHNGTKKCLSVETLEDIGFTEVF